MTDVEHPVHADDEALRRLEQDDDIKSEEQALQKAINGLSVGKNEPAAGSKAAAGGNGASKVEHQRLNWQRGQGGHQFNDFTKKVRLPPPCFVSGAPSPSSNPEPRSRFGARRAGARV